MKYLLYCILLFISSELFSNNQEKGYVIRASLTGFSDSTKFSLKNLNTDEVVNSAILLNGKFAMEGTFDDGPELLWLYTYSAGHFKYTNLFISNENVLIAGDIKDFPSNLQITGSTIQDDYTLLLSLTKKYEPERDSLLSCLMKLPINEQEGKGKVISDRVKSIDDTCFKLRLGYIKANLNTYPAILYLGYMKNELPKDTVRQLFNKLSPEMKAFKLSKSIEIFLKDKILEVGDPCYNFEAINPKGEKVTLLEISTPYILLDFTTAYCEPCMQSISELKKVFEIHKDSLMIVSFSADNKKEVWLNAVDRDKITWTSFWNGNGIYSETCIRYGVQGFPTFILIGPDRKIADKWSGYGKGMLIAKLKSIIKY
jgi:thiol-disulfide isomerase/thioredoxin